MSATKQKQKAALVPQYMRAFACIGSECEDSCCQGWTIDIDKATYKKYANIKDRETRQHINKHLVRRRPAPSSDRYGLIKLDESRSCPMLTEDKLCSIQLKLGEEFLSHTCATYPRMYSQVNDVIEMSASMSCPETARLALLNPDGIEFDEVEIDPLGFNPPRMIKTDGSDTDPIVTHFWELRIFTIQVLQNRSYSLADRMILLGLFYQSLLDDLNQDRDADIPSLIRTYTGHIETGTFQDSLQNIPQKVTVQINLLKKLIDHTAATQFQNNRYVQSYREFAEGLGITTETSSEELAVRYQDAVDHFYKPFLAEHGYILENYLVNHVFTSLFPLGMNRSVFANYTQMIVQVSLLKMILIGMSAYHKGLTPELALRGIQSFARANEHHLTFFKEIIQLFEEEGFATLPYMTVLIKN